MTITVMKTTTPIVAPTTTPMGTVVEDEGDEEPLGGNVVTEEAADVDLWRGVVILIPIACTQ
jgi:hypothetical protein